LRNTTSTTIGVIGIILLLGLGLVVMGGALRGIGSWRGDLGGDGIALWFGAPAIIGCSV
jgi:hypothetical protein